MLGGACFGEEERPLWTRALEWAVFNEEEKEEEEELLLVCETASDFC